MTTVHAIIRKFKSASLTLYHLHLLILKNRNQRTCCISEQLCTCSIVIIIFILRTRQCFSRTHGQRFLRSASASPRCNAACDWLRKSGSARRMNTCALLLAESTARAAPEPAHPGETRVQSGLEIIISTRAPYKHGTCPSFTSHSV